MSRKVQIQLTNPCTQNWEEMNDAPGGKFCTNCDKKVIDFTLLNDRQMLEIFSKNEHLCGRFTGEQLNRELEITAHQSNAFIPAAIICTVLAASVAVSSYAATNTGRKRPLTEKDSIVPVQQIRCSVVIPKDLSVRPFVNPDTARVPIYLGGARMKGIRIETKNTEDDLKWFWFFR